MGGRNDTRSLRRCFMLGYVLSPISPAVVVPSILSLHDQGECSPTALSSPTHRTHHSQPAVLLH